MVRTHTHIHTQALSYPVIRVFHEHIALVTEVPSATKCGPAKSTFFSFIHPSANIYVTGRICNMLFRIRG